MGYDDMDMEEQSVGDAFEQLERDILEHEAVEREMCKKEF
jgi:hypothetical protein